MPTKRTVLIVDDDPDMRDLERTMLLCSGYDVRLASNGSEALRELERSRPCMVLLDLMMPVMDGLTFLLERGRSPALADIPVVCVTAGGPEMLQHALRLGALECLEKPADFDRLCERVAHHCEQSRRGGRTATQGGE